MCRGFETFRFAVIVAVLLVVSVSQGKDVSLSELPQAVRLTIERETRSFEIEDIDRDNDDGKVVYEVEAESADGRRTEFVVAEDGSLIKFGGELRAEDMPAQIAEAAKKAVGDVVFFRIRKRVSPGEKLRYEIEADTEATEISLQIAADGSIINKNVKSIDRNNITDQGPLGHNRKVLIKLRDQLKIAAFGDSRGQAGINPWYFGGEENRKFPMALNFSTSGAGLGRCKTIIEDYLHNAPNLEWVVYGTSPRIFNKYYDNWGGGGGGSAYRTDKMGWGVWKQRVTEPVPRSALKGGSDTLLGYEVEDEVGNDDYEDEDDKKDARDSLRRGRYEFDAKRVNAFEAMIGVLEKRNVKLLAFTPPIHPVSAGQPCADDDGTTREAYDELVAKMRAFEKKYRNLHFYDLNDKGRHKIPGTDFDDMDHLNNHGSKTLTLMLNEFIESVNSGKETVKANQAKRPGLLGARYGGSDFEGLDTAARIIITSVDKEWTHGSGDYSCRWYGFIVGPFTSNVKFDAEADNGLILKIDGKMVIHGKSKRESGSFSMVKGKSYPVEFSFFTSGYPGYFRLYWSWDGHGKEIVDPSALYHTEENERFIMHEIMDCKWWKNDAPFHFKGKGSEVLNFSYQDGRLPPVVGVHNYQVFRANHEHPEYAYGRSNTYHHQPFIAYWNGKIYVEFVSSPKNENQAPQPAVLAVSETGRFWSTPQVIFPAFRLHDGSGRTVAHHRMGFYVSSNNRLLVSSFYDLDDSAQDGLGVGRVVREVYKDGTLSPIYFIRYNRHEGSPGKKWDESNTPYPLYTASKDAGFVEVCKELLSNKLYRQQWWEEERSTDGFYSIAADGEFSCEAFDWYTRADGKIVGIWKHGFASISTDGGSSWAEPRKVLSIITAGAKTWGQKTNDGRYAMAYNPHIEWRYPLVVITSDDGYTFSDMACIHGEVPDQRYKGSTRELGPQYVRGISEGNGEPPEDAMWLVYSLSKEDVWVSRVPLPICTTVNEWVDDTFDDMIPSGGVVNNWNIYSGQWIPVEVVNYPSVVDKSLRLSDMDAWDYARAVRVFPRTDKASFKFDLLARQPANGRMEVEVTGRKGERPVRIELGEDGKLKAVDGDNVVELSDYKAGAWLSFSVDIDAVRGEYSVSVNNKEVLKKAAFAEKVDSVERLSFRTGKYRMHGRKTRQLEKDVNGEPVGEVEYYINNVSISR